MTPPNRPMDADELRAWLEERVVEFGTQKALAEALSVPGRRIDPALVSLFLSGNKPREPLLLALGLPRVLYAPG